MLQQVLERHPQIDGIRPILAIFLSAQGRHSEANEQLTKKAREAGEPIMTSLTGLLLPTCCKVARLKLFAGSKRRSIWEMRTTGGLKLIPIGPTYAKTRGLLSDPGIKSRRAASEGKGA